MTDNEIIKALECLCGEEVYCGECEYFENLFYPDCKQKAATDALSLIKSQKEKIELLNLENLQMIASIKHLKAEAIKEFAGKIQKHCTSIELNEYINTLVEEMVGESNG